MDNKSTTKRMIGAVVLVLIAALLLAWLLKGKNKSVQQQQELIADQTNQDGSTPILGFPGVKEGEEGAKEGDDSYVIGGDDTKQEGGAEGDATQQVAQTDDQKQATDDAGKSDGATGTVAGAATGAVTAGKEAVQNLANNFQVRDSDEQRQVVDDGKAKAGTGSMGSSELALPKKGEADATQAADAGGDATQQQNQTQTAEKADDKKPAAQEQQTQTAGSGSDSGSAAQEKKPAAQNKAGSNVKLVGEKAVPAPRSQSRQTASADRSKKASSGSGSGSSAAKQTATGGKGYAIQVLAASSRSKAEQVRKSISVDGYPVFVVKARVNNKTVYRVRVGTYPARNAARAVQTKMKARYTKNQYVQNSFVTKN